MQENYSIVRQQVEEANGFGDLAKKLGKTKNMTEEKKFIWKLFLFVLPLFEASKEDFELVVEDLAKLVEKKEIAVEDYKVICDLCIELMAKGLNSLTNFVHNSFRKISKSIPFEGLEVLNEFVIA